MITTGALTIAPQGEREIVMTRGFDAPRRLVYEAYTTPVLLKRWLGVFGDWALTTCEMDVRAGGRYRWQWTNRKNGRQMTVTGEVRDVVPPERLVMTEQFDDPWYPGGSLNTTTFSEEAGRTLLVQTMQYVSREARDGVLASPMETGLVKSYDRMGEFLPSLAAGRWIEEPELATTRRRRAAVIRVKVPRTDMPKVMPPAIQEVVAAARALGIGPDGPLFAHHHEVTAGTFDFEVGVPVTGAVTPTGRVVESALPEARVARTVYHGPYEGLHEAWGEFDRWLGERGMSRQGPFWEVYAVGPETSPDPADWRTELVRPLAD
jgi:uncharacterized protein YndB with AHSA1/START domain/effector-binding domain-containing protein